MVLTVLVVPVLIGAFLLLMEQFEARFLGGPPATDVDDERIGPDSNHAAALDAVVGGAHVSQLRADQRRRRLGAGRAELGRPPAGATAVEAGTST